RIVQVPLRIERGNIGVDNLGHVVLLLLLNAATFLLPYCQSARKSVLVWFPGTGINFSYKPFTDSPRKN
ncbi:MAG: hypothetical protein LBK01_02300, partial [Burkholderiaceae bacterium]|nr:hypothetical protein [Burkholderiaceae bacterium]